MSSAAPSPLFDESGFEALASAIDRVAPQHHNVFLCKLAILLASHAGPEVLAACIPKAERHLAVASPAQSS